MKKKQKRGEGEGGGDTAGGKMSTVSLLPIQSLPAVAFYAYIHKLNPR